MELVVFADDRSGAIETGGALADEVGGTVPVATSADRSSAASTLPPAAVGVVDLGSRRVSAASASSLAAAADRQLADVGRHAHKIDSMLRGNWAAELVARHRATGRRILVVPALPALDRTCIGGVVLHGGRPVHEGPSGAEIARRTLDSRPDEHLRRAGASGVELLPDADAVGRWIAGGSPFAVCDASSDHDLAAIVGRWTAADAIVLAGTSAVIAAAGRALLDAGPIADPPVPEAPVVVVCGSLHAAARSQLDRLRQACRDRTDVVVVATPRPSTSADSVEPAAADAAAAALARSAHDAVRECGARTVVVIGGDTAAAYLGDETVYVGGTIAPGAAWFRREGEPLTIVRSGGFGGPDALVDLLAGTLSS